MAENIDQALFHVAVLNFAYVLCARNLSAGSVVRDFGIVVVSGVSDVEIIL